MPTKSHIVTYNYIPHANVRRPNSLTNASHNYMLPVFVHMILTNTSRKLPSSHCLVNKKPSHVVRVVQAANSSYEALIVAYQHPCRHTIRRVGGRKSEKAKFPNRDSNPGRVGESHVS